MKRVALILLLSCSLLLFTGCATIMTGKYQEIPITSEPSGAQVTSDAGITITTPGKMSLRRNEDHILTAEHPGYEPQQLTLHDTMQGWVLGNAIFGGLIGLGIDAASGASDKLVPGEVHFDFKNPELTTKEAVKLKKKDKKTKEEAKPEKEIQVAKKTKKKQPVSVTQSKAYAKQNIGGVGEKKSIKTVDTKYNQAVRCNNLGVAYRKKGNYDRAIKEYTKAIELDPGFALAYNNRAVAWVLKRDYDRAWDDVEQCLNAGGTPNQSLMKALIKVSPR